MHYDTRLMFLFGLVPALVLIAWKIIEEGMKAENPFLKGWLCLLPLVVLFFVVLLISQTKE